MKDILIVKNITREGPGLLLDILKEERLNFTIIDLSRACDKVSLEDFGAVVILGGPDSANDLSHKMEFELALISEVLKLNIPYLGICLGLQTLVKAAGGQVVKSPVKEIGFRDTKGKYFKAELTEEGKRDYLFQGLGHSLNVFHLHGETAILKDNMKLLATGKHCLNQIVKIGPKAYGIQCHFELNSEMFEEWINNDPDLLKLNVDLLRSDFLTLREEYIKTGYQLFKNFLRIAGYLKSST